MMNIPKFADALNLDLDLELGQTAHPADDKLGLSFEIRDKDGNRVRMANVLVERAVRKNPDLRYLRYVIQTLYRMQRCRIASGNGQIQLEKALAQYIGKFPIGTTPESWETLKTKRVELPEAWGIGAEGVVTQRTTKEWLISAETMYLLRILDKETVGLYAIDRKIPDLQPDVVGGLLAIEKRLEAEALRSLKQFPIWTEYLAKIKGIGPRIGGLLIAVVATPERFENAGKIWKYFGVATVDGKAQRRSAGQKSNFSAEGKQICYKIGESFIKSKGGYRELYNQFKAREVQMNESRPDVEKLSQGHVNRRAIRRVYKLFLAHFLFTWREMEGLPNRTPYPIEYLGHSTVIHPFIDD